MNERYFFDQDCSSHWYMIPSNLRKVWDEFTVNDIDDEDYDKQDAFESIFSGFRLGGGISEYEFLNPIKN